MCFLFEHSGKLPRAIVEEDNQEGQRWTEKAVKGELYSAGLQLELSLKTSETQRLTKMSNLRANWPVPVSRKSFLIPRNLVSGQRGQLSAALTPLLFSFSVFGLFPCPQRCCNAGREPPESLDPALCCLVGCTVHCCSWMVPQLPAPAP